jgi:hypothetical protein
MSIKQTQLKTIKDFKVRFALDATDENVVTTIHLMNTHLIDKDTALDQSSLGSSDYGIDGWYYDSRTNELFIYQSKLTDSKGLALRGLKDLTTGLSYLEKIIVQKEVGKIPTNKSIYNLYIELAKNLENLKKISFILISPLNPNDLLDAPELNEAEKTIRESDLYKMLYEKGGRISLDIHEYNFEKSIAPSNKKYTINKLDNSVIRLRNNSFLEITFIPIYNLVQLYRQRGDILFHKNVRLSLYDYKDAKNRVVTPMEATLDQICKGQLNPNIFPFYHVGITISATTNSSEGANDISLETPYVINGCQTITIADHFLRELENKKNFEAIEKFREINVLAKVVIGTTDEELKEITNCNNRQNPIENWQLFSNDPIHIEIESSLLDLEIFYERQKGKFNALMHKLDIAKNYSKTNQTFVDVETVGQLVALAKGNYQWTAKPSEIYINKQNHDSIFTKDIPNYGKDIVFCSNLFKAAKRGLTKYLELQVHNNEVTWNIFNKPIVKAYVYRTALLYYYQKINHDRKYADWLYKIASPTLVAEFEKIYAKFVTKTKNFYLAEQARDVSSKKLTTFFDNQFIELGIDTEEGVMPFTTRTIDWNG